MISAPISDCEQERLDELYRYNILDTSFEQSYDEIVRLAAKICDAPIALFTIIDKNRQWFKAMVGVEKRETPRDISFCAHAIAAQDILEVTDTLEDERFFDNPLVLDEPFIRFYAGIPLRTSRGQQLGTICVIDTVPRSLTDDQKFGLNVLGKRIVQQMEYDLKEKQLKDIDSLFGRHYINVLDSINFGEKVQKRLVFRQSELQEHLKESFVLLKQKTLISNTFCFLQEHQGEVFIAQYDCEKEGFAGLFLGSVVQDNLARIIEERGQGTGLGAVLCQLNASLHNVISSNDVVRDWKLNIGLCCINKNSGMLSFCGAGKYLYMVAGADRARKLGTELAPFGNKSLGLKETHFREEQILPSPDASFYLLSGGVAGQRGAEGPFGKVRLANLLTRTHKLPMDIQAAVVWDVIENWKGSYRQEDDILGIGFRI